MILLPVMMFFYGGMPRTRTGFRIQIWNEVDWNNEAYIEKMQACILKFSLDALTPTSGRAVRSFAESPREPKIPANFSAAEAKFRTQGQVTTLLANK